MEHFLSARMRCYYDLELPRGHRAGKRWPVLIALHGFRGNKDSMMRLARRIGTVDLGVAERLRGDAQAQVAHGPAQEVHSELVPR